MRSVLRYPGVRSLAILFGPSLLLPGPFVFYLHFGGVPHFLVHTLMGWDAGLIVLLIAALRGARVRAWEGALPVALAFWAMAPDFIYVIGPYHRDWMDLFLFHVSLDEILPWAATLEALVWLLLLAGCLRYRALTAAIAPRDTADQRVEEQALPSQPIDAWPTSLLRHRCARRCRPDRSR